MKKAWILIITLLLILSLGGCSLGKTPEFTFPESTTVLGVDISGMNRESALAALESAVGNYTLDLTVDGVTAPISGQEIGLTYNRDLVVAGISAMEAGTAADFSGAVEFNEGKLRAALSRNFNKTAMDASIVFDEASDSYVLLPHADGQRSNPNALVAAVRDAVCCLAPAHTLTGVSEISKPNRSADDPAVLEALDRANKMLGTELTYTFTPDKDPVNHLIPNETLRSFIVLNADGFAPTVNRELLDAYINELSETYSIAGSTGSFVSTNGSTIGLTVSYNGHYVDNEALAQDIIYCMQEGISETRTAPYVASGNLDMAYGGNYVEVNLSAQHMWFYKNGECILESDLVSGCVAEEHCTPTGVFSIVSKSTDTYLVGEDYRTFVNYWMPFFYGYGLHDATWRGSFGGSIYLYGGSHGCVNLPLRVAAKLYENVSVGTKVILYGGVRKVDPVEQSLSGTTSYKVADDTDPFTLNIKPKYPGGEITYASDNTSVASVNSEGKVTVKKPGTANITVTAKKHSYYTKATTTVTVKVYSACEDGRHSMGKPTVVVKPTCQPGVEKVTCTKCKYTTEQEIAATDKHSYGEWVTTKEPTCNQEGTKEKTCTTCNEKKKTGTIPATGKHTEGDWEITKEPTCTKDGQRVTKCTSCGTVINKEAIPATGIHQAGDWETVTPATCTDAGTKHKCCVHCGAEMETGTVAPGHTPGDWETVTAASCTAEGTKAKYCTRCGTELETATVKKKKHKFNDGASCENCGAANPDYVES